MSKEKQIEEMACAMCGQDKICGGVGVEKCIIYPDYQRQANRLYNADYRKQSEGEWVTVGEGITERVVCSNCKSEKGSFMQPPFCNQCGARMKGKDGEW